MTEDLRQRDLVRRRPHRVVRLHRRRPPGDGADRHLQPFQLRLPPPRPRPMTALRLKSAAYTAVSNVYNAQGQLTAETENSSASTAGLHPLRHHLRHRQQDDVRLPGAGGERHGFTIPGILRLYRKPRRRGPTGTYQGGQLTYVTTNKRSNNAFVYSYAYTYTWTGEALQSGIAYKNASNGTSNTTLTYGGSNNLTSVSVGGSPSSTVTYVTNANGQILDRTSSGGSTVAAEYFYLNDHQIGSVGNSGSDQQNLRHHHRQRGVPCPPARCSRTAATSRQHLRRTGRLGSGGLGGKLRRAGRRHAAVDRADPVGRLIALVPDRRRQRPDRRNPAGRRPGAVAAQRGEVVNPGNNANTFKPYNACPGHRADSAQSGGAEATATAAAAQFRFADRPRSSPSRCSSSRVSAMSSAASSTRGAATDPRRGRRARSTPSASPAPAWSRESRPSPTACAVAAFDNAVGQGVAIAVGAQNGFELLGRRHGRDQRRGCSATAKASPARRACRACFRVRSTA